MSLDKRLKDTDYIKTQGWGKLVSILKRQSDDWVTEALISNGYRDFKLAHMPFIMNIAIEGTNNNDLAKRARVTKQAMSKVSKELQKLGYIQTKIDPKDKRSSVFLLTDKGKKFIIEARLCVKSLMDEYRKAIGKNKFDTMLQTMVEVIEYNDEKLLKDEK